MAVSRRLFFGAFAASASLCTLDVHSASPITVDVTQPDEPLMRDGDVLIIESEHVLSQEEAENLSHSVRQHLPAGVTVLVLDSGLKARLLRPEPGQRVVVSLDGRQIAEGVVRQIPSRAKALLEG